MRVVYSRTECVQFDVFKIANALFEHRIAHIRNWWKHRPVHIFVCNVTAREKKCVLLLTLAPVRLQLRTQCRTAFQLLVTFLPLETVFHRSVAVLLFLAVIELRILHRKNREKIIEIISSFRINQRVFMRNK